MKRTTLLKHVRHIFFPETCLFCGKPVCCGELFCKECAAEDHQPRIPDLCANCGQGYDTCRCGLPTVSVYYYEEGVRQAVHRMKFDGERLCAEQLAALMAARYRESGLELPELIVPVPLHPMDRYLRGFSQTNWLCRALSAELLIPWEKRALRKIRRTKKQHALSQKERRSNLSGAFCVRDAAQVKGKRILLVDDVSTTGSTLTEAALALKQAGAGAVFALTAAKTRFTGEDRL